MIKDSVLIWQLDVVLCGGIFEIFKNDGENIYMLDVMLVCLAFGALSGILAGLFGVGGGIVLVPFFIFLFERQGVSEHFLVLMAVATSLATMIVTSIATLLAHHRLGAVIWHYVWRLSAGIFLGVSVGAYVADYLLSDNLRFIFALYLFYVAVQMALQLRTPLRKKPVQVTKWLLNLAGIMIGFVSAVLGIGGGTLTVPLLAKYQVPMRNAVAVSSACGLLIAVMGSVSYVWLGWNKTDLPIGSFGYVYLPAFLGIIMSSVFTAPIGATWANRLPTKKLKQYFSILLFAVAGKLLWPFMS